MLARLHYLLVLCIKELECVYLDDGMEIRHFSLGKPFPYDIVNEKYLRLGVIHKMVDIAGLEFMKKRYRNCSISHCSEERDSPIGLVSRADGHFVAFLQSAFLKHDVKLFHTPCHIAVFQRHSLIVGDCRTFPVLLETSFKNLVN